MTLPFNMHAPINRSLSPKGILCQFKTSGGSKEDENVKH